MAQRKMLNHQKLMSIIHIDTILHGAHLVGIGGDRFIPNELKHTDSLHAFKTFFVNKFINYHMHELAY